MEKQEQRRNIIILAIISMAYFILFCFPNAAASADKKMILVFQPDEAVPLPYLLDMIQPAPAFKQALINFFFYRYYFYGFPFFAFSALALLPLKWAGQLQNTTLVMLMLRQGVSLLPMLGAIWIITYIQTQFRSYKTILLFLFLISLPAVVSNHFWWHPDGLAIAAISLALLFLIKDQARLDSYFYISAALCGFSAMTKGIGFFFFLAVAAALGFAFFEKKLPFRKVLLSAGGFLIVLATAYFLSNPSLVYSGVRQRFFNVMASQSELLQKGYELYYPKGISAALPELIKNFGPWPLTIAAWAACFWGIFKTQQKYTCVLILAWSIPLSVMAFFIIHFKFQYWLPVALPLFSCLSVWLPDDSQLQTLFQHRPWQKRLNLHFLGKTLVPGLFIAILIFFTRQNAMQYQQQLHRQENDPSIQFYSQAKQSLKGLPTDEALYVYHDVHIYIPEASPWVTESIFEMLDYDFIEQRNYDMLWIMQERIYDYLNPNGTGIDPKKLNQARIFYQEANQGSLSNYRLVYRDAFGLVFVKNSLWDTAFP